MQRGSRRCIPLYPNAKLTVLGTGMSEQPVANFTCAAKAMGGEFTAVKSTTDLEKLLRQTLGTAPEGKPAKPAAETAPPQAAPAENAKPESGEKKLAASGSGSGPATSAARSRRDQARGAASAAAGVQHRAIGHALGRNAAARRRRDVGDFQNSTRRRPAKQKPRRAQAGPLEAARRRSASGRPLSGSRRYGFARAEDSFAVNGSKTEKTVSLNAGTISAEGMLTPECGRRRGCFLHSVAPQQGGGLEELGRSSELPAIFQVNAGEYVLSAMRRTRKTRSAP